LQCVRDFTGFPHASEIELKIIIETNGDLPMFNLAGKYAGSHRFDSTKPNKANTLKDNVMTTAQAWEYIQNHLLSESACSDLDYDGKLALAIITDIIRDQLDDVGHTLSDFEP
jgi:hypothetical protein